MMQPGQGMMPTQPQQMMAPVQVDSRPAVHVFRGEEDRGEDDEQESREDDRIESGESNEDDELFVLQTELGENDMAAPALELLWPPSLSAAPAAQPIVVASVGYGAPRR